MRLPFFLLACSVLCHSLSLADEVRHHRLLAIDVSSSMGNAPLKQVRAEIAQHLKVHPASPTDPISFLLFSDVQQPIQTFTNNALAKKFVSDHRGTRIGAGLMAAIRELEAHKDVGFAVLMLYTDDQDSDRQTIAQAEKKLAALFGERHQKGLTQAVLLRRWSSGGGLSHLATALSKQPGVVVLESMAQTVPITIVPKVTVAQVQRVEENALKVVFRVEAHCSSPKAKAAELVVTCPEGAGENAWQVQVGETGEIKTTVPLSETQAAQGQRDLKLQFQVQGPTDKDVLVLLERAGQSLPLTFESRARYQIGARLHALTSVRWDVNNASRVIYSVTMDLGSN